MNVFKPEDMKLKTLFMYVQIDMETQPIFFELEGDYSHLNEIFINISEDIKLTDELYNLLYDSEGENRVEFMREPTKDWDKFVTVGFF